MSATRKKKKKPLGRPRLLDNEPKPVDIILGRLLRARRQEMELSQTDLGKLSGINFQQVQKYENGQNRVSASRLHEFATALNVSILYFFPDDRRPIPPPVQANVLAMMKECTTLPSDTLKHMHALVRSFKAHGIIQ